MTYLGQTTFDQPLHRGYSAAAAPQRQSDAAEGWPEVSVPLAEGQPLYIAGPAPYDTEVPIPWLVKLLRLDVWGKTLLNSKARARMSAAATLLVVVFLFELTAWSLLFNVMVNVGRWTFNSMTALAVCLGLLFASTVFLFERSFLSMDTTAGSAWSRRGAYLLRLAVIGVSAVVTAHPIELLIFDNEIKEVLRDEAVYQQSLAYHQQQHDTSAGAPRLAAAGAGWTVADQRRDEQLAASLHNVDAELKRRKDDMVETSGSAGASGEGIERASHIRQRADNCMNNAKTAAERTHCKSLMDQAHRQLEKEKRKLGRHEAQLLALQRQVLDLEAQRANLDEERKKLQERARSAGLEADESNEELRKQQVLCIQQLVKKAPGTPSSECAGFEGWNPYRAGFVKRVVVLYGLVGGAGAGWPSHATERDLRSIHVPGVLLPGTAGKTLGATEARVVNRVYYASFAVACIIPLLTLAFKILQGEELRAYYSTKAQADAGNWQAMEARRVQRALEQRPAPRQDLKPRQPLPQSP